ncbi:hypothetical protein COT23_00800 [Candidatus Kaiserbacteria bacterium CG08_land_8_20_14_0_20_50_21]|uniref:Peptidase S74 domain-containing protein n=1 Tax=Candidatus Kaiserbacteria bacterium CG08_land_8_20_14_0_20_50_21 TaxID=1974604 RepID=A0A2H0Z0L4_9BACT|nr:MAG: hypothetical protein COT23_00800 [Candidatus Kaiserbacteria bacterium CG08_land_8_20_14_0_20_50_21]
MYYSRTVALVLSLFLVAPIVVQATTPQLYTPGATLNPDCAPTDSPCGISSITASGTVGQVPYYATAGSVLAATSTITILSSGNVGIGTTSPSSFLHIYNGASGATPYFTNNGLIIENSGSIGNPTSLQFLTSNLGDSYIFFGDPEQSDVGHIVYKHDEYSAGWAQHYQDFLQGVAGGIGVFSFGADRTKITQPTLFGLPTNSEAVYSYLPDAQVEIRGVDNLATSYSLDAHNLADSSSLVFNNAGTLALDGILNIGGATTGWGIGVNGAGLLLGGANFTGTEASGVAGGAAVVLGSNDGAAVINTDNLGVIGFAGHNGTIYNPATTIGAQIRGVSEGTWTSSSYPGALTFLTTPSGSTTTNIVERLRISSAGNVGIGTTTPFAQLSVHANNGSTLQTLFAVGSSTASVTTTLFSIANTGNVTINGSSGSTCVIGNGTSGTSCSSDERFKTNIALIHDALNGIEQIKGVTFNWADPEKNQSQFIGVIAQDVQKVFPQAVSLVADGILSVDYAALVAPLIEAVKDLARQVSSLAATVAGFANTFTTNNLCIKKSDGSSVCITGDQLGTLLNESGQYSAPSPNDGGESMTTVATTTDAILTDSTVVSITTDTTASVPEIVNSATLDTPSL